MFKRPVFFLPQLSIRHFRAFCILFLVVFVSSPVGRAQSSEAALRQYVKVLTSDSLAGRGAGTSGERKAADYISRCFASYGLEFIYPKGVQDFSVVGQKGDTIASQNIVAILSGSDPQLREEYIVIAAHYDHLGSQKITVNGKDSVVIYPGADDNASGVALLLEMAKAAAAQPYLFKRSLVFVAFGAEEIGLIGSWYFVNRAFAPINKTVLMLNLDMIGRSGSKNPFCAYTVEPHPELSDALLSVEESPLTIQPKVVDTDYFPSDHKNFFLKQIPAVLFTSGLHSDYHSHRDKVNMLDYSEMTQRMNYIYAFLLQMANTAHPPLLWSSMHQKSQDAFSGSTVYSLSEVDKLPKFQHGDEEQFLKLWVNKYLKYPDTAIAQGIQGRVVVQFIIEPDGSVTHVEVIRSVDPLLDDEAVRVVSASPKWKPGTREGKAVRVRYAVPVYFVLKKNR